jgi:hypothetical protein
MRAKGILDTADMVPSMATSAISFELMAADSNSNKKAMIARITSMVAVSPQLIRFCNGDWGKRGATKAVMPVTSISARQT